MRSVSCKRTNAVRRNNKEQISDWIGTRLFVCAFASGQQTSVAFLTLFPPPVGGGGKDHDHDADARRRRRRSSKEVDHSTRST